MHNQQGFIGFPVLLAILVGLAVLGGGAYYVVQQKPPQTISDNFDNVQTLPTRNNQPQAQAITNALAPTQQANTKKPKESWFDFAVTAKTEADCEMIPVTQELKTNCYYFVAKATKNASLCAKAATFQSQCNAELAQPLYTEAEAKVKIGNRASEVIATIKNSDFTKLATYVHPQKGVRFSPYGYVSTQSNLVFSADKIKNVTTDQTKYVWGGYDGSGFPMELTFEEYFKSYVYSHDFANATEISYNRSVGSGNTLNNILVAYPNGTFVEYRFPGLKYGGMDWQSLRLIFEELNGTWYLVGVVHAQWTI